MPMNTCVYKCSITVLHLFLRLHLAKCVMWTDPENAAIVKTDLEFVVKSLDMIVFNDKLRTTGLKSQVCYLDFNLSLKVSSLGVTMPTIHIKTTSLY